MLGSGRLCINSRPNQPMAKMRSRQSKQAKAVLGQKHMHHKQARVAVAMQEWKVMHSTACRLGSSTLQRDASTWQRYSCNGPQHMRLRQAEAAWGIEPYLR